MTPVHFLWPRPKPLRALVQAARFTAITRIEAQLSEMFPSGTPVLFSSGRTALIHALLFNRLLRNDKVGVFPYASHCVLDSVARVATPTAVGSDAKLNVIFQQWGYAQHHDLSLQDIEDSVDSLLMPGAKLFYGGGGFDVWSLPKILGTTGGGVLWCRTAKRASALRQLRDGRKSSNFLLWALRLLGIRSSLLYACWQGAEASFGRPSRLQTGEILAALSQWNDIVTDRQNKLNIAWQLAPNWLSKPVDRLPCVVPVELRSDVDGEALAKQIGIASGLRWMECPLESGGFELTQVLPIPVHQDVSFARLNALINCIAPLVRSER
jgi:putative PLP-dependent aminotransferase (TIGR04422 family)